MAGGASQRTLFDASRWATGDARESWAHSGVAIRSAVPSASMGLAASGAARHRRHGAAPAAQPSLVLVARQFLGAELRQVRGDELRVQQPEAAQAQPRDQVHQRHLRGVAGGAEHALAEEHAADRHAVEAADQVSVLPGFHRMGMAELVQFAEQALDLRVDPGIVAAGRRMRAAGDGGRRNRWSTVTAKASDSTVRARRRGRWKRSSGMMPRRSGSSQ